MECRTGRGEVRSFVTEGNSASKASYSAFSNCGKDGLGETTCEIVPFVCKEVVASRRRPCLRFTSSPYSLRKSAPMIGVRMSAIMKIHWNIRRRPKSMVRDLMLYVGIEEPLTALSPRSSLCFRSAAVGGMILTSAPVSIRKQRPEILSHRNNRRLCEWPAALAAESEWPSRFPPSCRVGGTLLPGLQTSGDSSITHQLARCGRMTKIALCRSLQGSLIVTDAGSESVDLWSWPSGWLVCPTFLLAA